MAWSRTMRFRRKPAYFCAASEPYRDYEYELQMALMNRRLQPRLETVFLLAGEAYSFISSKLVKEVISLGGSIAGLVPPAVEKRLRKRVAAPRTLSQAK